MSEIKTVLEIETESLVPSKDLSSRKTKINPCDRHHRKQTRTTRQMQWNLSLGLKGGKPGARGAGIKVHLRNTFLHVSQAQCIEVIVFFSDCLLKKAKGEKTVKKRSAQQQKLTIWGQTEEEELTNEIKQFQH